MQNLAQRPQLRAQERSVARHTTQHAVPKPPVRSRLAVQRCRAVKVNAILTPEKPTLVEPSVTDRIPVYYSIDGKEQALDRPRVVVLGSGWAAMSFIKSLPKQIKDKYEVILVSPRNFFLYTPLLPAVATGTVEERSIVEPVRNQIVGKGDYYEAVCKAIDPKAKELVACFPKDAGLDEACFKISYDVLIIGVGSVNNTFGIQGVDQYCNYFKSIEDAQRLRRRVSECFERAALPACPEDERKKLLSFVVVGGGPTGVEVAAEMYDMVHENLRTLYPSLIPDVKIRVVELMDHVLSTYDRKISDYTAQQFKRSGIELVLNSRVASVRDGYVAVVNKEGAEVELPFGACVWATGIAKNPLIKQLQESLPGQTHFRSIQTDEYMRVLGSDGSIWAFGDAATIEQPKALERADELFERADTNKDGKLSLGELRVLLNNASKEFPHLEEHARFLDSKQGAGRFGGLLTQTLTKGGVPLLNGLTDDTEITKEVFHDVLEKIDKGLRALPATAQVAQQQGKYLASLFTKGCITGDPATSKLPDGCRPFQYWHKGSLAYVGGDRAVMDVPTLGPLFGMGAGFLWRGYETFAQISLRNQVLVFNDWIRTKVFGRDISRV